MRKVDEPPWDRRFNRAQNNRPRVDTPKSELIVAPRLTEIFRCSKEQLL